jgi:hypothetical protein
VHVQERAAIRHCAFISLVQMPVGLLLLLLLLLTLAQRMPIGMLLLLQLLTFTHTL